MTIVVVGDQEKIADQVKSDFAFKRTVDELMELVKNS